VGFVRRSRKTERDEDDAFAEPEDEAARAPEEAPQVAYRVAGDVQVRAAELEQEVVDLKRQMGALEREVWAARKKLRAGAAVRSTSIGGLGALVGAILGGIAYGVTDEPRLLVATTIIGFVFGVVGSAPWKPPDDDFPAAPPPRLGR
jgi:hypothetical protein